MSVRRVALGCAALVAAMLPLVASSNAQALQAPVAFTSTSLAAYQTNGIAWAVAAAPGQGVRRRHVHLGAPGRCGGGHQ